MIKNLALIGIVLGCCLSTNSKAECTLDSRYQNDAATTAELLPLIQQLDSQTVALGNSFDQAQATLQNLLVSITSPDPQFVAIMEQVNLRWNTFDSDSQNAIQLDDSIDDALADMQANLSDANYWETHCQDGSSFLDSVENDIANIDSILGNAQSAVQSATNDWIVFNNALNSASTRKALRGENSFPKRSTVAEVEEGLVAWVLEEVVCRSIMYLWTVEAASNLAQAIAIINEVVAANADLTSSEQVQQNPNSPYGTIPTCMSGGNSTCVILGITSIADSLESIGVNPQYPNTTIHNYPGSQAFFDGKDLEFSKYWTYSARAHKKFIEAKELAQKLQVFISMWFVQVETAELYLCPVAAIDDLIGALISKIFLEGKAEEAYQEGRNWLSRAWMAETRAAVDITCGWDAMNVNVGIPNPDPDLYDPNSGQWTPSPGKPALTVNGYCPAIEGRGLTPCCSAQTGCSGQPTCMSTPKLYPGGQL